MRGHCADNIRGQDTGFLYLEIRGHVADNIWGHNAGFLNFPNRGPKCRFSDFSNRGPRTSPRCRFFSGLKRPNFT